MEGPLIDAPEPVAGPRGGWAELGSAHLLPKLLMVLLGVWMNAADSLVTATIMPNVAADLGGYAAFSWAVAGFLIGSVIAGASAGRVAEIFGLGPASAVAGATFAVGCAMGGAAHGIDVFLAGRLVQGVGSGWFSGFAMVAIAQLFPERQLARVFAIIAGVWGVATLLGPMVGGLFAAAGNWRAVFWIFLAQAVLFALLAPILFRDARAIRARWSGRAICRSSRSPGRRCRFRSTSRRCSSNCAATPRSRRATSSLRSRCAGRARRCWCRT